MSDARETAKIAVSQASVMFQKRFPDTVMSCIASTSMGCCFTILSLFMDIQNSFKDIYNSFMDILKCIFGYP